MIELYCDGSCPKPNGPGGWAFIVVEGGHVLIEKAGGKRSTTNNQMELEAAIQGLEWLLAQGYVGRDVRITSDSQYVIKGIHQWVHAWRRQGWRRRDRDGSWQQVSNVMQWKQLFHLAHEQFTCTYEWVRGHNGHHYNELCDKLAGEATWSQIEGQ